jgi:hypothetical protein
MKTLVASAEEPPRRPEPVVASVTVSGAAGLWTLVPGGMSEALCRLIYERELRESISRTIVMGGL